MKTLRGRMTDLVAMVLALALLAGWLLIAGSIENRMHEQARNNLESQLAIIAGIMKTDGLQGLEINVRGWPGEQLTRVTVIAMDGKVLFDNEADPATMDNHAGRPEVRQALLSGDGSNLRYSRTMESDYLYLTRLAATPDGTALVIRVSRSLAYIAAAVSDARWRLLASLLLAGAVSMIAGLWFVRQITSPLEDLTRSALRLQEGESFHFPASGSSEVQRLASALQDMSQRLDSAIGDLRLERGYLKSLLESLPVGVLVVDSEGRIRYANAALSELLRDTPRKMENTPYLSAIKAPELLGLLEKAFRGAPGRETLFVLGKTERFLEAQALPIESGALVVLNDLTERQRLEEARRTFVADAGHELQTPLTAIRAAAELLVQGGDVLEGTVTRMAGKIVEQQERMTSLVDDMLLLSRLESGTPPVEEPEDLDLASMLGSLVENFRSHPLASFIEIEENLPEKAPFRGASEEMRRAFGNLLDNAVKYTRQRFSDSPGGRVLVCLFDRGDNWELIFEDNGVGVPPEVRETVFERFQRGERHRSRSGAGGYGLGLAIVKRIVSSHGGRIETLEPQEGALFRLLLPKQGC